MKHKADILFKNSLALLVDNLAAFDMDHGNGIIKVGKTVGTDEPVALGLAIDGFRNNTATLELAFILVRCRGNDKAFIFYLAAVDFCVFTRSTWRFTKKLLQK